MRQRPVIAVLGGSFNPPHLGHVLIPTYVLARGLADRVVVAPCWSHPFAKSMAPFADRMTWTRLAMAVHGAAAEVSPIEAELAAARGEGPSYTVELLEAIADRNPESDVRLVVGTDIVLRGELDRWHRIAERIAGIEQYTLYCAMSAPAGRPRTGAPRGPGPAGARDLPSRRRRRARRSREE